MKILVFSDTHNYLDNAREVLWRIGGQMDMVLHLGDHDTDAMELKKEFPSLPFHYVLGNNDYSWNTPDKKMVFAGGKKLLLVHGHKQRVYWNYDSISYWAEEQGADAVLFGHTHRPVYDDRGRVMLLIPAAFPCHEAVPLPHLAFLPLRKMAEWKALLWNITEICLFAD